MNGLSECAEPHRPTEGENGMNHSSRWFALTAALVFSAATFSSLHALAGHKQTFTGEVGDSMCGRKHMEGETAYWDITIPPNAVAYLSLAPEEEGRFRTQGKPLKESFTAANPADHAGQVIYTIPSGHFSFVVQWLTLQQHQSILVCTAPPI